MRLRYRITIPTCFALGFFVLVLPSRASAATYYVANSGDDGNSCATAQDINTPKQTLNNAVTCLTPGFTLYIRAGTYNETLQDNIPSGTSWSSPVTVAAYPGETVTLAPTAERVLHFQNNQQYIVIDRLILDGSHVNRDAVKITYGSDPNTSAHHIRIQNSEIKNAPSNGVLEGSAQGGNEYINNNVHNNGFEDPNNHSLRHGFYIGGPKDDILRGNYVHDNSAYGIQIQYDGGRDTVVEGNWMDSNQGGGMVALSDQAGLTIRNNIFSNNFSPGLVLAAGHYGNPTKLYNNTFYNNRSAGYYHYNEPPGQDFPTIARNNIFWLNDRDIDNNATAGVVTLDHNLAGTDPKFVNAAGGDFHLQSNSPAINAGVTLSEVPTDKDGATRPVGSAYDVGVYEYGGVVTSPTPTPTPTLPGDLNNDHIVNSLDWSIMNSKWFKSDAVADLNNDGIVNSLDFSIMNGNWLKSG